MVNEHTLDQRRGLPLDGMFHALDDRATRDAAALHGSSLRAIKVGCRAGMGPCQARICGPSLQALACDRPGQPMDLPVVQVPLRPVRSATIVDAPTG